MKANELRIGNYFKPDMLGGAEYDVIKAKDIMELEDDPQDDYYQPLPLTPEWLYRCGFGDNEGPSEILLHSCHSTLMEYYFWNCKEDKCVYLTGDNDADIVSFFKTQYVHQLQNLYFALTGEELTVNL